MPELPEVETIKRDLQERIVEEKISQIQVKDPHVVKGDTPLKDAVGRTLKNIARRGKLLILELEDDSSILIHLKMTGQLIYCKGDKIIPGGHTFDKDNVLEDVGGELPNKHTRVIFSFSSGERVFFNDMRRFGYVRAVSSGERKEKFRELGPEPLSSEFGEDDLRQQLKKRKTAVKKVLLDQKVVAGVGNIYADEALFRAGIRPQRSAFKLTSKETKELHRKLKEVLRQGVRYRGTTFDNYRDGQGKEGNFSKKLRVYGREGEKCGRCGGRIKKIRLSNRGTHYCPHCQK